METLAIRKPGQGKGARSAAAFLLVAAVGIFAYANSLHGPLIFDDIPTILDNPSIRSLWPPSRVLWAPPDASTAARPLGNVSFALNFAAGGLSMAGYHAVNLAIHILAGFLLFAIARQTLAWPGMKPFPARAAGGLALVAALLWVAHPLNTQAVTYITQRCESLAALCMMLALYGAVRGWRAEKPLPWHALAVFAFLAGTGVKETVAGLPFFILLYDRTFVHRTLGKSLSTSRFLYAGLGGGWVLLGLILATGRAHAAVGPLPFTVLEYARTQAVVLAHYLRLAVWPRPLVLDYAWPVAGWSQALPYLIALGAGLALTARGLWQRRPWALALAWCFLILAPTSSFLALRDLANEHRMYAPLAGLILFAVLEGYRLSYRIFGGRRGFGATAMVLAIGVVVLLGSLTWARNADYRTKVSIWQDTTEKRPENPRAWASLSAALGDRREYGEAEQAARRAVELDPAAAAAWTNLGISLQKLGRTDEAVDAFQTSLALRPSDWLAHQNLAVTFLEQGNPAEALPHARAASELQPTQALSLLLYALTLKENKDLEESGRVLAWVIARAPSPEAFYLQGQVENQKGNLPEAGKWYSRTLEARPGHLEARYGLARVLERQGRVREAADAYGELVRRAPDQAEIRLGLARVFCLLGRTQEAAAQFNAALMLAPDNREAARGLDALQREIP